MTLKINASQTTIYRDILGRINEIEVRLTKEEMARITREYNKISDGIPPNRTGNDDMDYYLCPNCNAESYSLDEEGFWDYFDNKKYIFCESCGQKIDWRNKDKGKVINRE